MVDETHVRVGANGTGKWFVLIVVLLTSLIMSMVIGGFYLYRKYVALNGRIPNAADIANREDSLKIAVARMAEKLTNGQRLTNMKIAVVQTTIEKLGHRVEVHERVINDLKSRGLGTPETQEILGKKPAPTPAKTPAPHTPWDDPVGGPEQPPAPATVGAATPPEIIIVPGKEGGRR